MKPVNWAKGVAGVHSLLHEHDAEIPTSIVTAHTVVRGWRRARYTTCACFRYRKA